jgi:replicative superfamily II helicase
MGVNLKIKRLIFTSLSRRTADGVIKSIEDHEIRQIAGRAGRYMEDGKVAYLYGKYKQKIQNAIEMKQEKVIEYTKDNEEPEEFEEMSDGEGNSSENALNRE